MPLGLEGAFEDEAGQEDGQDGVGVHFADQVRRLPDYAQIGMVDAQDNAGQQQERVVGDLSGCGLTLVTRLISLRREP